MRSAINLKHGHIQYTCIVRLQPFMMELIRVKLFKKVLVCILKLEIFSVIVSLGNEKMCVIIICMIGSVCVLFSETEL